LLVSRTALPSTAIDCSSDDTAFFVRQQRFLPTPLKAVSPLSFPGGVKSEMLARGLSRVGAKSSLADAITKPPFAINPDQTVSVK